MRHLLVNRERSYVTKFFSIFLNFVALSGESNYMEVLWLIKGCSLFTLLLHSLSTPPNESHIYAKGRSLHQAGKKNAFTCLRVHSASLEHKYKNKQKSLRWRLNNSPTILSENHNEKRRLIRGGWQKGVASSFPMIMKGNMNEINVNGESNECEQWIKWMWIK